MLIKQGGHRSGNCVNMKCQSFIKTNTWKIGKNNEMWKRFDFILQMKLICHQTGSISTNKDTRDRVAYLDSVLNVAISFICLKTQLCSIINYFIFHNFESENFLLDEKLFPKLLYFSCCHIFKRKMNKYEYICITIH